MTEAAAAAHGYYDKHHHKECDHAHYDDDDAGQNKPSGDYRVVGGCGCGHGCGSKFTADLDVGTPGTRQKLSRLSLALDLYSHPGL